MPLVLWTNILLYRSLLRLKLALLSATLECKFVARCIYKGRSGIGALLRSRVVRNVSLVVFLPLESSAVAPLRLALGCYLAWLLL